MHKRLYLHMDFTYINACIRTWGFYIQMLVYVYVHVVWSRFTSHISEVVALTMCSLAHDSLYVHTTEHGCVRNCGKTKFLSILKYLP